MPVAHTIEVERWPDYRGSCDPILASDLIIFLTMVGQLVEEFTDFLMEVLCKSDLRSLIVEYRAWKVFVEAVELSRWSARCTQSCPPDQENEGYFLVRCTHSRQSQRVGIMDHFPQLSKRSVYNMLFLVEITSGCLKMFFKVPGWFLSSSSYVTLTS